MTHSLVATGSTQVPFADPVPVCPAVVSWVRCILSTPLCRHCCRRCPLLSGRINQLFVGCGERLISNCQRQISAVSCCKIAVSSVAASARLLSVASTFTSTAPVPGVTPCAPPSGLPPFASRICCCYLRCAKRKAVFHAGHIRLAVGRPSQLSTSWGKCCTARTAAEAIMTSSTSVMGMPTRFAFLLGILQH